MKLHLLFKAGAVIAVMFFGAMVPVTSVFAAGGFGIGSVSIGSTGVMSGGVYSGAMADDYRKAFRQGIEWQIPSSRSSKLSKTAPASRSDDQATPQGAEGPMRSDMTDDKSTMDTK